MNVSRDVAHEQRGWERRVDFYRAKRRSVDDLYPSERLFLSQVLPRVETMLDIGCAAGGFSEIAQAINPRIAYTGVDITPAMIERARLAYPERRFEISDGISLPFDDRQFDLVFSTGILHVNSRFAEIVASAYRVTRRFLLVDFRLTNGGARGQVRLEDGNVLPYYVLDPLEVTDLIGRLAPAQVIARGYPIEPTSDATVEGPVTAAFYLVERGEGACRWDVQIERFDAAETPF